MHVAFIPFSVRCPQHSGSASIRLRVDWMVKKIEEAERVDSLDSLGEFDIVVLQKVYGYGLNEKIQRLKQDSKKIIVDICDPDWTLPGMDGYVEEALLMSDAITVPTEIMKEKLYDEMGINKKKIHVIEDSMDLDYHNTFKEHLNEKHTPILVWFGNSGTIQSLKHYLPDLEEVYKHINFKMVFITNNIKEKIQTSIPHYKMKWSLETVNNLIISCDVSINTKIKGEEYKSNNKTLTSWACGIPCIEIWPWTNRKEWMLRLQSYLESPALRIMEGKECRKHIEKWYNTSTTSKKWNKLLNELNAK